MSKDSKITIRFKILSVIMLLLVALTLNSIWSIWNFRGLRNSIEEIMQSNFKSIEAAQNMTTAIERQDSAELAYMFKGDADPEKIFWDNEKTFLKWLTRAEDNVTETGEKEILDKINDNYTAYRQQFALLNKIQEEQGEKEARVFYYKTIFPMFDKNKNEIRNLLELNQNAMVERKANAEKRARNAIFSTTAIAVFSILAGLLLAIYLTNKITKPVYSLIEKMKKITEGDYSQRLEIEGNDEIAKLAMEFNRMTEKLKAYERLNISALMEEKQKAEAIVESIGDGIVVTDEENRIVLVNGEAERALGIREKEVINKHFLEGIKREDVFEIVNKVKDNGNQFNAQKYFDITVTLGEDINHYRVNVSDIRNRDGKVIGIITLLQNITKLKEVDQLKSDFVSTVSHEFRTPLTSMSMAVGLLLDGVSGEINEEQRELVQAVQEDTERLTVLVSELLDLSRIESGKMQMDIQKANAKKIVDYAIKPFARPLEEKNIELKVNIKENISMVKADPTKIAWVITNLVGNAIRYTPYDGSGIIEINAKETANKMLISVTDNGKGIPEDYQKKIFDKFIQVKGKNGEVTGGAGLGLAISKEIIRAHGGEIWVSSSLGKGTTFYFTLHLGT